MGFFDRIKSFASRAVGAVGNVVRRVGDFAAPVAKQVGKLAGMAAPIVGVGGEIIGGLLGQPEIAAGALALEGGLNAVSKYANKGSEIAGKVSGVGSRMQDVSKKLS